jgi:hypothetical protein
VLAALNLLIPLGLAVLGLVSHLGTRPECLFDFANDVLTFRAVKIVALDLAVALLGHLKLLVVAG